MPFMIKTKQYTSSRSARVTPNNATYDHHKSIPNAPIGARCDTIPASRKPLLVGR